MANEAVSDKRGQRQLVAKSPDAKPAAKKHHHRWRLLTMLATLGVVLWCLPIIVAQTPLLAWGLKLATADVNGSVSVKSAKLGWLSPIEVRDIEVKDREGKQVMTVASVTGDRRLGAILLNYTNLGKFTIAGTKLNVVMRDDGTNVEDLLAKYLTTKNETEKTSSTKIGVAVDIVDAAVSVSDERAGLVYQAQKLSLTFGMAASDGSMNAELATDLHDARGAGKVAAGVRMGPAANEAKVIVAQFPLGMLRPLVARFLPGTTITGRLSSEVTAAWGDQTAGKNAVKADLNIAGFSLAMPAMQTDVLQLANVQAECRGTWQADRIDIEQSSMQCDVGIASLTGTVPLGGKDGFSFSALMHQRQQFSGGVDLAKLAQMLPATLSLRSQMRIDAGQVRWLWTSQPDPQGAKWHGEVDVASLAATDTKANRPIAWDKPILAVFDAHDATNAGLVVDRLRCESDFLNVEGAGTTDNLTAKLQFSLGRLADRLDQFVNFGATKFAGEGDGNLTWKRSPDQQFDAGANLQIRGFQLQTAADQKNPSVWREDSVVAYAAAKGRTNFDAATRIEKDAMLTVKSGSDQIEVKLMEPVENMQNGGVWKVWARVVGQLQNMPARLAVWLPTMSTYQLNGNYIVEGDGVASKDGAEVRQIGFAAEPLGVKSPLLNINEQRIEGVVAGSWNQQQRRLRVPAASIRCSTAAITAKDVVMAVPAAGATELSGAVDYQGDAGRIRQWFADAKVPSPWRLAGQLRGAATLQQNAGVVHGVTTAEVTNLAVVDSTGKQFQEPIITLTAKGDYDTKAKTLQLSECALTSSAVTAAAAGHISQASGQENGQLDGKLNYDLERLSGLLRPCLGPNIRITGRGSSTAMYRGPFALAEGSAAATLCWDGANLYGFAMGPAELKATMANGVARIEPLDLAVGGGRVHLAPQVRIASTPMELSLPRGPLVQKVQISPEMCGSGLQYIAPALAGVTTAQGTFSIDLDDCRIPIGDLNKANVTGRFTIHSMAVGPGTMTHELATFLNRETPAQLRNESVVPFQVLNGRVYHKDLELIFPDITIRSSGSVGMADQSMDITVQMPVPAKWQAGNTALASAVRNQTISVPLRGTLAKPALDQRAVADLSRQFMQRAASNAVQDGLNRLFAPKK
jgi:translocation and assembly module TamB